MPRVVSAVKNKEAEVEAGQTGMRWGPVLDRVVWDEEVAGKLRPA